MILNSTSRKDQYLSRLRLIMCLLLAFTLLPCHHATAQVIEAKLVLTEVNTADFPNVKLSFRIENATPQQLYDPIRASELSIIEGDELITVTGLESHYRGTHFLLAVNSSRNLALRDYKGISNFEKMVEAIKELDSMLETESLDHYSYFLNPEYQELEMPNFSQLLNAIENNQDIPAMRRSDQNFDSLEKAIAAHKESKLNQDSVLLYFAPYLYPNTVDHFIELIAEASEQGLPIHTWMALEYPNGDVPYKDEIRQALEAGGGSLFFFSGSEELPNPKTYIQGLGYTYHIEYESLLRSDKNIQVAVQINSEAFSELQSNQLPLNITIEAAQLRFLNFLSELTIEYNREGQFTPTELPLEFSIEFPDNYPREIVSTSLWIDGKKTAEKKEPPFDNYILDLSTYKESTTITVRAKLLDAWGLEGQTPIQKIQFEVIKPETFIEEVTAGPNLWLFLAAGIGVLLLTLVFVIPQLRKNKTRATTAPTPTQEAPSIATEKPKPLKNLREIKKESRKKKAKAKASETSEQLSPELTLPPARHFGSLLKLDKDNTPSAVKPFLLTKDIVYIGRDPKLADLVLDDPAIEPLHAELHFFEDGRSTLTDFKTTAGTYRNYRPLTANTSELQHGDILHFGTIMYRFHSATRTSSSSLEMNEQNEN